MASSHTHGSPGSSFLHGHVGAIEPASPFAGGSQPSGSEYGFGTPQSLSIDTMLQCEHLDTQASSAGASNMASYRSAPANMMGNLHGMVNTADSPAVQGASAVHHGSVSSLPDRSSPMLGQHLHRASTSSNGPYSAAIERQNSMGGSETTSPANGARGFADLAENTSTSNSNNHINSQADEENPQTNQLPAWSELKTKAGKERKRLPLACIACRRKKIRCSGEKPACKHCLKSRIPCVYKVTTRKAAPRTDYMAMLDKRLKRMEERVIKIIPKEDQGIVTITGRAVVKPGLPPAPPKQAAPSKKRVAQQAFGDDLDEWANSRTVAAEPKAEASTEAQTDKAKVQDADDRSLLIEGADKLPPREVQQHLSEVFFDYVYGQSYHLLHKPSFMRKLAADKVPPVLTLAMCAIAARFSNHPAVRTEPAFLRGENWATAAREISLRRYDTPNITILIVYLILGLHEFGTCQGGRSWMFGGMAQRMAYALQLHRDLDHDPKTRGADGKGEDLTFTDREIRRRTMWSCFLMDRFNSSGTDRPIFVAEQYIRAQLPIKEKYYQMEITGPTEDLEGSVPNPIAPDTGQTADAKENMGVAAYLVRIVAIWGRVVHYLNLGGRDRDEHAMWADESMFQAIAHALNRWKEELPPSLQYSSENLQSHASEKIANQFLFLHIVYCQTVLFLNRFALPIPGSRRSFPEEMPPTFIQAASKSALDAANQISALIHEAMEHSVVAPFAGYSAFFSSTVHIHGAFSKIPALEASSKQNLAWNVKYLTRMKKYWGMFHFVTENLRDIYRRHADAARRGVGVEAATGDKGTQPEIFQYGDWFDRYPHGVSGTDYEEPSAEVKKEPGGDGVLGQKSDLQTVEEFFSKLPSSSQAAGAPSPLRQQQRRKKRTKSEANKQGAATTSQPVRHLQQQEQIQRPQQDTVMAGQQSQQPHPASPRQSATPTELLGSQNMLNDMINFPEHPTAYPPGFQQPSHPLLMGTSQHLMSQLDRQMVLNSYAGVDPAHNLGGPGHHPLLDSTPADFDPFPLDAFAASYANPGAPGPGPGPNLPPHPAGSAAHHLWGDPSAAWFMPFNMQPPSIADDNNLLSSDNGLGAPFDWTAVGAFADLPPGLDVDLAPTGPDGRSGGGGGDGGLGLGGDGLGGGTDGL